MKKAQLSAKRIDAIARQKSYLERFYSQTDMLPPRPDGLSVKSYQIFCRLFLLANEIPDGTKIKIYLGDICEDAHDLKTAGTNAINLLQSWRNVPCLFTQQALLAYLQYEVSFVIGYDPRREYLDPQTKIVLRRATTDDRQRRFF